MPGVGWGGGVVSDTTGCCTALKLGLQVRHRLHPVKLPITQYFTFSPQNLALLRVSQPSSLSVPDNALGSEGFYSPCCWLCATLHKVHTHPHQSSTGSSIIPTIADHLGGCGPDALLLTNIIHDFTRPHKRTFGLLPSPSVVKCCNFCRGAAQFNSCNPRFEAVSQPIVSPAGLVLYKQQDLAQPSSPSPKSNGSGTTGPDG